MKTNVFRPTRVHHVIKKVRNERAINLATQTVKTLLPPGGKMKEIKKPEKYEQINKTYVKNEGKKIDIHKYMCTLLLARIHGTQTFIMRIVKTYDVNMSITNKTWSKILRFSISSGTKLTVETLSVRE